MVCITKAQSLTQSVLDLPELLETIILSLSMPEIQRCRQVSKQWKATIDSSPSIRKALFLEPGTADDLAHDARILKVDPEFFHSGAQSGISHYAVHALFIRGWPHIKSVPVEHFVAQAGRLPGVFLTQPPRLTRMTRLWVCRPGALIELEPETGLWVCRPGALVELESGETFDSLGAKLGEVMPAHKMDSSYAAFHWLGIHFGHEEWSAVDWMEMNL
ncbi:hypothetical protein LTR17_012604 [Elasticomyces elasticus]|nr:hypothetical protein LTR17_012604 [Elasticomyces elasticus]